MDICEEIFERARVLVQEGLSEDALAVLREMCLAAFYELSHRLREDVSAEDIRGQFVPAAATLGLSLYVGIEADNVGSVSAGSVKISRRGGSDMRTRSNLLRKQAELMLAAYLKDGGFAFRAVRA